MPKVSVIIPTYNRQQYVPDAVCSVLSQDFQDIEVIVVDDGSTDHTGQLVQSLADDRVRYLFQENRGAPAARNRGIEFSRGTYLIFLDSDDLLLPGAISAWLAFLENHPAIGLTAGGYQWINSSGDLIKRVHPWKSWPTLDTREMLLRGSPFPICSVVIRKEWVDKVGRFDSGLREGLEDWNLWLRLAEAGCRMEWVKEIVFSYRIHFDTSGYSTLCATRARLQALDGFFGIPSLDRSLTMMKDKAYGYAYLRNACDLYLLGDFVAAKEHLRKAIHLCPDLLEDQGQAILNHIAGEAFHPRNTDPLVYIDSVFDNLPEEADLLHRNKGMVVGKIAETTFWTGAERQKWEQVRRTFFFSLFHNHALLRNRGYWSVILKAFIKLK